jgi:hypothetical protein
MSAPRVAVFGGVHWICSPIRLGGDMTLCHLACVVAVICFSGCPPPMKEPCRHSLGPVRRVSKRPRHRMWPDVPF